MKCQTWRRLGAALMLVAVPVMGSQIQRASADEEADGRIVEISPNEEDAADADVTEHAVEAPQYWIGLQGRPIENSALRTHLQLADDVGVQVENVVPGSPAEKAGLRQHDIIVAVNGEPISDLSALQKVVAEGADKAIDLKVIRLAKEMKVAVKPEERPADVAQNLPGGEGQGRGGLNDVESLLRQLQEGNIPGGMRVFGPGMVGGQGFNLNKMPEGLSVSITRQGEGPAEITVKKGDKTWTLKGDDEEAIKKLPDDVRPFVRQMLQGSQPGLPAHFGAMNFDFGRELQRVLPNELGGFGDRGGLIMDQEPLQKRAESARKRTEEASERLLDRMEQMEQRIRDLQEQLQENSPAPRTNDEDDASRT